MNILHVADSGGIYGKERVILSLIEEQRKQHKVSLYVTGKSDICREVRSNISALLAPNFQTMQTLISATSPDVIHAHDYKSGIYALMAAKYPVVRTLHGYTGKGKPWYNRIHAYEAIDKFMIRHGWYTKTVGVSPCMVTDFGIDEYIPNGTPEWQPDPNFSLKKDIMDFCVDGFVLTCIARLSPEKNISNLINAVWELHKMNPNIKLLILGDGPLKDSLQRQIETLGMQQHIMLAGYVNDTKELLHGLTDVYIQPSLTEGLPISVLDALSLGIPTIVSNVGGMIPLVRDDIVMGCSTVTSSIASAILYAIKNPKVIEDTGERGFLRYNRDFTSVVMAERYNNIYQLIVNKVN